MWTEKYGNPDTDGLECIPIIRVISSTMVTHYHLCFYERIRIILNNAVQILPHEMHVRSWAKLAFTNLTPALYCQLVYTISRIGPSPTHVGHIVEIVTPHWWATSKWPSLLPPDWR